MSAFGSLYYTDCLPGQGLRGGAGFQFQAVSSDVTHEMMALTQRSTLYDPPVSWMREHRPVKEYPPSLTHAFDGCYVTARGVYLGAEANGVREGNQFTHAVATADAEAYGMVRPAQLWEAPWWSEQPAPTTECEPLDAEPEIGRWGIDAVREWILGQPEGEDWLTAVYSAVDRIHEGDRRVLFVSADPSPVLGWLTAATLLLPQARAVRVTFRVFATNPRYSEHDVLALHPDWAGQFANTRGDGEFVVFNLQNGTHSPVDPTEAATQWVPRFLRHDPYDVIDAVEMAHQFAESVASTSDILASRTVLLNEPATDARECEQLTKWLSGREVPASEEVVLPVANAVLAGPANGDTLRELDKQMHRHGQSPALRAQVRAALLETEIQALLTEPVPEERVEPLPPVTWPEPTEIAAVVEHAANTAEPARLVPLLRTASRFGVTPREHMLPDGIHRFARWWADNPENPVEIDGLPCGPALIDQLRDELALRFEGAGAENTESAIYRYLWRWLHPTIADPTTPLDRTTAATAIAKGNPVLRRKVLSQVMARIVFLNPANVVEVAWAASFRHSLPTVDELAWFLKSLPPGEIQRSLTDHAYQVLDEVRISADALDALEQLTLRGATPPPGRLTDLTKQTLVLRRWLYTLDADVRTISATILEVRADEVLNTLLDETPLNVAMHATELGTHDLRALLSRRLPMAWSDRKAEDKRRDTAVALAYLTATASSCSNDTSTRLTMALQGWATNNGPRHLTVEKLLQDVAPEHADQWRKDLKGPLCPPSTPRSSTVDRKPRLPFLRRRGRE